MVFTPIMLRQPAVILADFPQSEDDEFPEEPLQDEEPLRHEVGIHKECAEVLHFYRIFGAHGVIECLKCRVRIIVPRTVATYADLRRYCSESGSRRSA